MKMNIQEIREAFLEGRELLINDRFIAIEEYKVNFDGSRQIQHQFDLADGGCLLLIEHAD